MTLAISIHDSFDEMDRSDLGTVSLSGNSRAGTGIRTLPPLGEKLKIPNTASPVYRQRLHEMLAISAGQYGATLISGRAGTGKTCLAADFAARHANASWYSIDPTDIEWGVFSHYFSECIAGGRKDDERSSADAALAPGNIAQFLADCFPPQTRKVSNEPRLLVLDNVHHIFDAEWFCDFFNLLIASMPPSTHLLMLCRSRPPAPLWRLRSKQMLNVIDEKLLAFTRDETREFFMLHEMPEQLADLVQRESFGRISKIKQFLGIPA